MLASKSVPNISFASSANIESLPIPNPPARTTDASVGLTAAASFSTFNVPSITSLSLILVSSLNVTGPSNCDSI